MEKPDIEGFLRRPEAAKILGASLAKMTRLQDKGRLNPVEKDGVYFYDPQEVHELKRELERESILLKTPEGRKEAMAEYQLDTVRSVIGLVKEPREKIDAIQFQIISELRAENKILRDELKASREAVEAAKDQTAERAMAMSMAQSEGRIKETAALRMVETIGKLINGKQGVQLTPEQLEQLILANSDGGEKFLTEEQEKQAKAIVSQSKAKTNGTTVAKDIAKTVNSVVEGATP